MKPLKVVFAILFAVFAIVQYNDPDPWLWIFIYGLMCALFIVNLRGWYDRKILLAIIMVGIAYSLFYLPGVIDYVKLGKPEVLVESMQVKKPYIEQTREFGGLWICILSLVFLLYKGQK